jgi:hypothetical protein
LQHKAKISGLTMDPDSNTPIVILHCDDDRTLPIWIGLLEATAIATELRGIRFERPMTHDLFKNFAEMVGAEILYIEICDLRNNTYFARIHFRLAERSFAIDARPSDAMAIALRTGAPILIDDAVFDNSKTFEEPGQVLDESEEGRKWAEYLKNLSPDDFGKYKV